VTDSVGVAREVRVPALGDFKDVPVIEVLVRVGQAVAENDPLVTLESDKATMDVPAPFAGVIREVRVKVGDRVAEGTVLALVATGDPAVAAPPAPAAVAAAEETPTGRTGDTVRMQRPAAIEAIAAGAATTGGDEPALDLFFPLLVLGAGPGGYTAAFRAADLGQNVVLVDARPTLAACASMSAASRPRRFSTWPR
jgi:dihydrolipoamide dehydrogenase